MGAFLLNLHKVSLISTLFISLLSTLNNAAAQPTKVEASPKEGWREETSEPESSTAATLLLWLPNRVLDLWDVPRFDLGIGPSYGATVRLTRFVQISYRKFVPGSVRFGAMGRAAPVMWETSDEKGFNPFSYTPSRDRDVCTFEVGVGLDVFVGGAYAGMCIEEIFDFLGGVVMLDLEHDDLS
jgi:hypothetical protein